MLPPDAAGGLVERRDPGRVPDDQLPHAPGGDHDRRGVARFRVRIERAPRLGARRLVERHHHGVGLGAERRDHPAERTRGEPGLLEADIPQCFRGISNRDYVTADAPANRLESVTSSAQRADRPEALDRRLARGLASVDQFGGEPHDRLQRQPSVVGVLHADVDVAAGA